MGGLITGLEPLNAVDLRDTSPRVYEAVSIIR